MNGALDGTVRGLTQAADRRVRHRGTDQEHGLQLVSTRHSTRELEQLLRGRAERELVESRTLDTATDTKQARAGGLLRSDLCELRASFQQNVRHVHQRLDVVHDCRLSEESRLDREGRFVPRLPAQSFYGIEERRLLAADVGTAA